MLSGVLHSSRAIQVNLEIMRAFVKLRGLLESNRELSLKLSQLEQKLLAKPPGPKKIIGLGKKVE